MQHWGQIHGSQQILSANIALPPLSGATVSLIGLGPSGHACFHHYSNQSLDFYTLTILPSLSLVKSRYPHADPPPGNVALPAAWLPLSLWIDKCISVFATGVTSFNFTLHPPLCLRDHNYYKSVSKS